MKSKIIIILLIIVFAGIVAVFFVPGLFGVGPFAYSWSICENGYYSKYPLGVTDVATVYYDSSNNIVGRGGDFWGNPTTIDQKTFEKIGRCTEVSYWTFLFRKN